MERKRENFKLGAREKMKTSWRRNKLENESNVWRNNRFRREYCGNGGRHRPPRQRWDEGRPICLISNHPGEACKSSCRSHQPQEDMNRLLPPNILKYTQRQHSHDYSYTHYLTYRLSRPPAGFPSSSYKIYLDILLLISHLVE